MTTANRKYIGNEYQNFTSAHPSVEPRNYNPTVINPIIIPCYFHVINGNAHNVEHITQIRNITLSFNTECSSSKILMTTWK